MPGQRHHVQSSILSWKLVKVAATSAGSANKTLRMFSTESAFAWVACRHLGRFFTSLLDHGLIPWSIAIKLTIYFIHHFAPRRCLKTSSA